MLRLALRGVRHNSGRYIATVVAIITGVGFFAATGFLSQRVIDSLEGDSDRQYAAVDAAVVVDDSEDPAGQAPADDLRLPGDAFDAIAAAEGVEGSAGILTGSVAFQAADGTTFAESATGRLWIEDAELNPLDLADGAAPEAAGEITVDTGVADDEDLAVGDDVTLLTLAGPQDATITGLTSFGDADAVDDGGTVTIAEASAFDWLSSGRVEYEAVYLRGDGSEAALAEAVEPEVPTGFVAETGEQLRADQREAAGGFGRILKQALQAFALLALFVGAFVIYNTFSVIVAQRLRELAVLAAIGATPRQIKRSLRFEGLVIGLVGSVLGVVVGFGLAFVLVAVLGLLGFDLPGSGIAVPTAVVVQGILLGTIITFLSVMVPARRAARTEPIEALRDAAVESTTVSRRRLVGCGVLVALGLLSLLTGGTGITVGIGAVALFVGVVMAGPVIAMAGARLLRPLMSRLGLEGRLAIDNTARNPQRTATTANALLIGIFLVTFVTVAGTSAKDFAVGELQALESSDYYVESDGGTIDDDFVDQVQGVEGVVQVVPFRSEAVTIDGAPGRMSTGDLTAIDEVAAVDTAEGSLDDLDEGTIALPDLDLGAGIPALGDTVEVVDEAGDRAELEVVALLEASLDSTAVGGLVGAATFDDLVGDTAPTVAFIDVESGAQTDTADAIDEIADGRPDITVTAGNTLGQLVGGIFDFLINAVNGLLLMSVVVALIGIVNTLSLSILERRRELGLLRIVGMVDKRVQRMVRLESVLISAMGTVSGIVLGTFIGWATIYAIDRLAEADIAFRFPATQILIVLVAGVVLGVLASWIPARRSTRPEVLDAIQAT